MDGLEEIKSELRRVTANLTPLQTARNAEALKRDADQAYIDRLTAAAAPLEAQVLSLQERAKQLEGQAGGGSLDDVVAGIQELRVGQQVIQAVVAERVSQTRQASKIKETELDQVTTSLKCRIVWAEGDPPLESLLGSQPDEGSTAWWDEVLTEPAQREECAEELRQHIPKRRGSAAFDLHDVKGKVVKMSFEGVPYPVSGKNDEMVSLHRFYNDPLRGGIMGVELKKKLAWASVRQAETEFLLFAPMSWYPYCQVATDFVTGGIAFYQSDQTGSQRVIAGRVFKGMASFWDFFYSYLDSIPEDLASDQRLFADELPNPKRLRFELVMPMQSGDGDAAQHVHAALRKIANMFNNWGDVANLADLEGFHELGTHAAIPSYII